MVPDLAADRPADLAVEAVTFDLDGTLIHTADEIAEAVNRTLAEFRLAPRPPQEIAGLIGHGLHALMVALLQRLQREDPRLVGRLLGDRMLPALDRHYAAVVGTAARPCPGARATLDALAQEGVRLGCVTNKEGRHARRLLEACGLSGRLSLLVAGDSLPQRKPHPAVLRHAAARLGVPVHRLAHVGDSRTDIEAARAAGALAWAVPGGYDGGEPVARAGPAHLFDGLPGVAAHVIRLRRGARAAALRPDADPTASAP